MTDWNFTITTPIPPSVNHYIEGGGKHRHKSSEAVAFTESVHLFLNTLDVIPAPDKAGVAVQIAVYLPNKRRRDLDNLLKLLLDSFEGYLYSDDGQIASILIYRAGYDKANPRCELLFSMVEKVLRDKPVNE